MTNEKYSFSDNLLLQKYRENGDNECAGILLKRYSLLVFGVCMKYLKNSTDAKDASQQIFEKAILEAQKYDIPYFKSWIYSVARNHCLMQLRSASFKPSILDEFPEELITDSRSDHDIALNAISKEEEESSLRQAIDQLNEEQSICIRLFYLKKLSYQEIQEKTGLSFQQVKSHIQNGKRNLRIILEKKYRNNEKGI
jgi:RNA polymerase sigma-70 factor (ECF subfamily)